jgi:hypothetical protein
VSDPNRLAISVTHSDGRVTRWGPDEPDPTDIPDDLTFGTQIPGGDKDLSCSLLRRIDLDYPDQGLFDRVRVYGPGNRTVWGPGRMAQFPRSHGDGFQIVPGAVGRSAELTDDPSFREIYVDRDLSHWAGASVQRRLNIVGSYTANDPSRSPTRRRRAAEPVHRRFTGAFTATSKPRREALVHGVARPDRQRVLRVEDERERQLRRRNWCGTRTSSRRRRADDVGLERQPPRRRDRGPGRSRRRAPRSTTRHSSSLRDRAGGRGQHGVRIYWTCLAVYGTHGLTKQGTDSRRARRASTRATWSGTS